MHPSLRLFTIHTAVAIGARFRHRIAEWQLAGAMTVSGFLLLRPAETFTLPPYSEMGKIATEETWGALFLLTGIARIVILTINGAWRSGTSLLRAFTAFLCAFFWAVLLFGHMRMETPTIGLGLLAGAFITEFIVIYRAAGDTRTATNGNGNGGGNGHSG